MEPTIRRPPEGTPAHPLVPLLEDQQAEPDPLVHFAEVAINQKIRNAMLAFEATGHPLYFVRTLATWSRAHPGTLPPYLEAAIPRVLDQLKLEDRELLADHAEKIRRLMEDVTWNQHRRMTKVLHEGIGEAELGRIAKALGKSFGAVKKAYQRFRDSMKP